ncbi:MULTISPECIES: class I SAM-dependent methyltransferase [unclassified Streptomyces]|uniref:class I SAM-dependent methyltransferase n=1 Tax=unclassified Streptomyces TaxID=2593676 RepID=UPI0022B702CF|nr:MULTISPECIES: class I SAM-dependent methyltransferase [unclassified Streptomyces]MCZ7415885.1 class I SAM-dependent methyltransferase [Streptomyces sp. WMMC897]MCZ7434306.1 class I SAM-dependent methyltransferase [Streptomyces sp. WMMC1477]
MTERAVSPAAATFDAIGIEYERAFGHLPELRAAVEWLVERLPGGAAVLDVGSGTGRPAAELLAAAGCRVTGIDVSATMVELARAQVPAARFEQRDVRDHRAEPGSLDAVCAFFPFLQMARADIDASLARIAGWLAPGGYFVTATVPGDVEGLDIVFMGRPVSVTSYPTHEYLRRLEHAGLEVLHHAETSFRPAAENAVPEDHLFCFARRPAL